MKKLQILKVCSGVLLLFCSSALIAKDYAGEAGVYLRMGLGARAFGMGGAFTSLANDFSASYWNPAGLIQLEKREIGSMYSILSLDRKYNFLNYASPIDEESAYALSLINFGVSGIEEWRDKTTHLGKFTDSENTLLLSYARLIKDISIGGNIKLLHQQMNPTSGKHSGKGWGIDLGIIKPFNNKLYLGLILQDAGSYLEWDTGSTDKLPLDLRCGLGARLLDEKLNLCLDFEKIEERSNLKPHLGIEYWIKNNIGIRAGFNSKDPSAGFSLRFPLSNTSLGLDYSFSPDTFTAFDEVKEYNHRLSFSSRF
ncbi:MAG: PorV/PorQ family protein [bacterium]